MKNFLRLSISTALVCVICSCSMLFPTVADRSMKIQLGMSREDVIRIMGNPSGREFDQDYETLIYREPQYDEQWWRDLLIDFQNGRVVRMHNRTIPKELPHTNNYPLPTLPSVPDPYYDNRAPIISESDYQHLYRELKAASFDDERLKLFSVGTKGYYFSDKQSIALIKLFTWDEGRLKAFRMFYNRIVPPYNIQAIKNAFTFISAQNEAERLLKNLRY